MPQGQYSESILNESPPGASERAREKAVQLRDQYDYRKGRQAAFGEDYKKQIASPDARKIVGEVINSFSDRPYLGSRIRQEWAMREIYEDLWQQGRNMMDRKIEELGEGAGQWNMAGSSELKTSTGSRMGQDFYKGYRYPTNRFLGSVSALLGKAFGDKDMEEMGIAAATEGERDARQQFEDEWGSSRVLSDDLAQQNESREELKGFKYHEIHNAITHGAYDRIQEFKNPNSFGESVGRTFAAGSGHLLSFVATNMGPWIGSGMAARMLVTKAAPKLAARQFLGTTVAAAAQNAAEMGAIMVTRGVEPWTPEEKAFVEQSDNPTLAKAYIFTTKGLPEAATWPLLKVGHAMTRTLFPKQGIAQSLKRSLGNYATLAAWPEAVGIVDNIIRPDEMRQASSILLRAYSGELTGEEIEEYAKNLGFGLLAPLAGLSIVRFLASSGIKGIQSKLHPMQEDFIQKSFAKGGRESQPWTLLSVGSLLRSNYLNSIGKKAKPREGIREEIRDLDPEHREVLREELAKFTPEERQKIFDEIPRTMVDPEIRIKIAKEVESQKAEAAKPKEGEAKPKEEKVSSLGDFGKKDPNFPEVTKREKAEAQKLSAMDSKLYDVEFSMEPQTQNRVTKTDINNFIESEWETPILGKATYKFKGAKVAHYEHFNEIIRTKGIGEVEGHIHEIAHHIDHMTAGREKLDAGSWAQWKEATAKELGFTPKEVQAMLKELRGLDYNKKARRVHEGFAEYVRHKYTDTGIAEKAAPTFNKFWQKYTEGPGKEVGKKLSKLGGLYDTFKKQGAVARVLSNVDYRPGKFAQLARGKQEYFQQVKDPRYKGLAGVYRNARKWFLTRFSDDLFPVVDFEKGVLGKEVGRNVKPTESAIEMLRFAKFKPRQIAHNMVFESMVNMKGERIGPSLVEVLKPVPSAQWGDLLAYWIAKRSKNYHDRGLESGFDRADVDYIVKKHKNPAFDQVTDGLTKWSDQLLNQWLVESGNLGPKEAEVIRRLNPVYAPFKRIFVDLPDSATRPGSGRSLVEVGKGTKRRVGSQRPILNPFEAMFEQASEYISKAFRARVTRIVRDNWLKHPAARKHIQRVPQPEKGFQMNVENLVEQLRKQGINVGSMDVDTDAIVRLYTSTLKAPNKERIVTIWNEKSGKPEFFELSQEMWDTLHQIDMPQLSALESLMAPFSRMLRLLATGVNPRFGFLTNPVRDFPAYAVLSKSHTATVFDPFEGIYRIAKNRMDPNKGDLTDRFVLMGQEISSRMGYDRAASMAVYDDMMIKSGKFGKPLYVARHPIDTLRSLVQIPELAPRLVELRRNYKRYKREFPEWTDEDAFIKSVNDAQDTPINFSRMGTWGRRINNVSAFYNSASQGISRFYRALKERPLATTVKGLTWLTAPALINWYTNKDKQWYKNIPESYRYGNLWFEDDIGIYRVPIPFEIGVVFQSAPVASADSLYRKGRIDKTALSAWMENFVRAFPEVNVNAIGPWLDVERNKDWLGRPIETPGMKALPVTGRKRHYTTEMANEISKGLNMVGIEYSPIQVDYMLRGYLAGTPQFLSNLGDMEEPADIPGIGAFFHRMPERPRAQVSRFYEEWTDLKEKSAANLLSKVEEKRYGKLRAFYYRHVRPYWQAVRPLQEKGDSEGIRKQNLKLQKALTEGGFER